MNFFDIGRLFGSNSIQPTSRDRKRADLCKRGRTCRFEELEGREMLSVTPWSLVDDYVSHERETMFPAVNALDSFRYQSECASTAGNIVSRSSNSLQPLGAAPEGYNAYEWNLIESQGLGKYAYWTDGRLVGFNSDSYSGATKNVSGNLNLSGCTALEYVSCYANGLTSVNVSGCAALKRLFLHNNVYLTSLNVFGCTALKELGISYSKLPSLDVSGLMALEFLSCNDNVSLKSLKVIGCTSLRYLYCSHNKLTSLDVSGCTALEDLKCDTNQLMSINVSGCAQLSQINARYNHLTFSAVSQWPVLLHSSDLHQQKMTIEFSRNQTIDLSSEYLLNDHYTKYTWFYETYYSDGKPRWGEIDSSLYTETNGVFQFTGLKWSDVAQYGGPENTIYCRMTNDAFPNMWTSTNSVTITQTSTNYAVLFAGGVDRSYNFPRYYNNIKDMYEVLTQDYGLDPQNIWIIYADGTDMAKDRNTSETVGSFFDWYGKDWFETHENSDMTFATNKGSTVLPATYASLDSVFAMLGSKMTANDHLLFYTYDHGDGEPGNPQERGEEKLCGWKGDISDFQVANSVAKIKKGYITLVFAQCFAGGILDAILDPQTGKKRSQFSNDVHIYGMSAANHYEYAFSGFAWAFLDALRWGYLETAEAFDCTKMLYALNSGKCAPGIWHNDGNFDINYSHPWEAGESFSIFVSGSYKNLSAVNLRGTKDSFILSTDSISTINALEYLTSDTVYTNFAYRNPQLATVSATVTVTGGNLTQPKTFNLTDSSFTQDASGIGQLTANLNLGTFDVGTYIVCVEMSAGSHTETIERTFTVTNQSRDIGDTLADAQTVTLVGAFVTDAIGDGRYGGCDVDIFRYNATATDVGKTLVFETMGDWNSTMPVDTYIRLFNAAGVELATTTYSADGGYSSLFYTITEAGAYYIGISTLTNTTYNPNTANCGTVGDVGYYQYAGLIVETKPDLSVYYDYSWIDNLIVTKSPSGTIFDNNLTPDDSLYINYKFTNCGFATASATGVVNRITITGPNGYTRSEDFAMSNLQPRAFQTLPQNFEWGKLATGEYTIAVTLDVDGVLSELTTQNNTANWTFTVGTTLMGQSPTPLKHKVSVDKKVSKPTISSITLKITPNKKATSASNALYVVDIEKYGKVKGSPAGFSPITVTAGYLAQNGNRILIDGLNPNTSYKFKITAVNASGKMTNAKGQEVVVNITAKTAKYSAVQKLKANSTASSVTLKWTPSKALLPAGATTCYEIVWLDGGETKSMIVSSTTVAIFELSANTTYKFTVRAITTVDGVEIPSLDAKITVKTFKAVV